MANNWVNFCLQMMATSGNICKSFKGVTFLTHLVGYVRGSQRFGVKTLKVPINGAIINFQFFASPVKN